MSKLVSYQVSNKVPTSAEVRAYIKRSIAGHVGAAKKAEERKGYKRPPVGTMFRVGDAAVVATPFGYLQVEGHGVEHPVSGLLLNGFGQPYFLTLADWCKHIGANEEDVVVG
jgi:hypothetical protein